ncbi:MAG: uroporphyrinogen-III synthase, partial [Parahaliea sp.]
SGQADDLLVALEQRGLRARQLPLLALGPLAALDPAGRAAVQELDSFGHVIFISTNAVRFALPWLEDFWPQWPLGLHWYAVGSGTARALAERGIDALQPGDDMNSEGLLRLPSLREVQGQRVLIVKGQGGRELLREELLRRGARASQLVCYRRQALHLPAGELATRLAAWQVEVIMISSGEGLTGLLALLGQAEMDKWGRTTLLVPSPRVAEQAMAAGFSRVRVAANASDGAMLAALAQWQRDSGDHE